MSIEEVDNKRIEDTVRMLRRLRDLAREFKEVTSSLDTNAVLWELLRSTEMSFNKFDTRVICAQENLSELDQLVEQVLVRHHRRRGESLCNEKTPRPCSITPEAFAQARAAYMKDVEEAVCAEMDRLLANRGWHQDTDGSWHSRPLTEQSCAALRRKYPAWGYPRPW